MYIRVIPRDLFNEAKLLKCYGQLALLIHEGKGCGLQLEHNDRKFPGFLVEMDGLRNQFYCSNLRLSLDGRPVRVGAIINSKQAYPMVYVTEEEIEGEVFHSNGTLTDEFKNYLAARDHRWRKSRST